jgi:hypothetical protein
MPLLAFGDTATLRPIASASRCLISSYIACPLCRSGSSHKLRCEYRTLVFLIACRTTESYPSILKLPAARSVFWVRLFRVASTAKRQHLPRTIRVYHSLFPVFRATNGLVPEWPEHRYRSLTAFRVAAGRRWKSRLHGGSSPGRRCAHTRQCSEH